jgi:hypothetical protein
MSVRTADVNRMLNHFYYLNLIFPTGAAKKLIACNSQLAAYCSVESGTLTHVNKLSVKLIFFFVDFLKEKDYIMYQGQMETHMQGVTKRCRLSWLTYKCPRI